MLPELLQKKSLFFLLYLIDKNIAKRYRVTKCPFCGNSLHYANYPRKPRGEPSGLPEKCSLRFSLCCGTEGCRRRGMPPSCRFLDRKVYWHCVILIIITLRQNRPNGISTYKLSEMFGVSRKIIIRWGIFYRDVFPVSMRWQSIRGQVISSVKNNELPGALVDYFLSLHTPKNAVIACLKFLSQDSGNPQKIRAG